MFRILTKRISTCLFFKKGVIQHFGSKQPKSYQKKCQFSEKLLLRCSLTKTLLKILKVAKSCRVESGKANPHKRNNFLYFTITCCHVSTVHPSSSVLQILKSPLNLNRARCYKVRYIALAILRTEKFKISDAQLLTGRESGLCVSPAG